MGGSQYWWGVGWGDSAGGGTGWACRLRCRALWAFGPRGSRGAFLVLTELFWGRFSARGSDIQAGHGTPSSEGPGLGCAVQKGQGAAVGWAGQEP